MNPEPNNQFTREPLQATLAAGAKHPFRMKWDYFWVHKLQAVTEVGADVEVLCSINGFRPAPIKRGEPGGGVTPGRGEIRTIEFENTSGAAVFIRIIGGIGARPYSPETVITNPTLALDPATILALNPAAQTGAPNWEFIAGPLKRKFSGATGISIICNAGTVTVKAANFAGGVELPVSQSVEWTANGRFDVIGDVTVEVAAAGEAEVVAVGATVTTIP